MVGSGAREARPLWHEGLPEGSLLLAPLALVAFLPLALGAALVWLGGLLRVRSAALLAAGATGAVLLLLAGPEHALASYRANDLLWQLARARFSASALQAGLPVGLAGGALVAALASAFEHAQHPFWVPRERASVLRAPLARRRTRSRLAAGAARPDGRIALGLAPDGGLVSLSEAELAQHALILGATGSGKTTSLLQILRPLIAREAGVVLVDLKADPALAGALAETARRSGRPFERWSLDGPASWNPLARGTAIELTDKLIALEEWSEPHYKRAAQRYLHTVLAALLAAHEEVTLARLVRLLDPAALTSFVWSPGTALPEEERLRIERYAEGLDRSSASAVQGLCNRLALLAETNAGAFLAGGERAIDLGRTLDEGRVTLFSLDAQAYGETAVQLATLVVLDLRTLISVRLAAAGGPPRLAFAALDEFSAIRSDQLVHLFARGRSAGLGILLATQELADLSRVDPGFAAQVLANTNVKLVHRQDVPESAERLAALAGTRTVYEETFQTDRAPALGHGERLLGARGRATGRGTIRQSEEYVVHRNELLQLRQGSAVVIRKHPRASVERVEVTIAKARERRCAA